MVTLITPGKFRISQHGGGVTFAMGVSSITRSLQLATCTTSAAHGFLTGAQVTVSGADQPEYNGTYIITVLDGTSFTYTVSGTPDTPATGSISVVQEAPPTTP